METAARKAMFATPVIHSFDCVESDMSPISSRNIVPSPASSFGHMVKVQELDGGIISDVEVLFTSTSDVDLLVPSVKTHIAQFGRPPTYLAADRGFSSADNEEQVKQLHVQYVALPAKGKLSLRILDSMGEAITAHNEVLSQKAIVLEAERLMSSVGLSADILESHPHKLSGGELQRVAIARALAVEPNLLILDEPTSALDVITQTLIISLLQSLRRLRGFSILFITHDFPLALSICDRAAIMYDGQIVEEGAVPDLVTHPVHEYTRLLLRSNQPRVSVGGDER